MSTHKHIDKICAVILALTLAVTVLFINGAALGIGAASKTMGYENRLFDPARVHTVDIVMDDWDGFIQTCENEEYAACAVIIDGESYKNVGIRAKGNTSLSTVSSMNSGRYSFKIEFDHYDSGKTCHGLDKLNLNNIIQDNTYMKDYLTYRMMGQFGANAPLCSFAYITVNGQDWGLYLAIEGLEDSFLQRNYGQDHGALYKPDSMSFGGGRGNGRDFNMGGMGGGMGSSDVKLQYSDDDPDSYANIFDNAKTKITQADQARLIQSLKALGEGGDMSGVVDIDQVLRYFVVHNFVVNGDSYTGSMVHNYYLYEEEGRLSILPWDYNLAFGTFQGNRASSAVNDPIDTPLSVTGNGDRPMADWIFSSGEYTELYHQYFREFLNTVDPAALIDGAYRLIAPYAEKDPTKFCTTQEFETGVEALKSFCALRAQSVSAQLDGTIPSTDEGQSANPSSLVDASALSLSDMGTMTGMGGMGRGMNGGPAGGGLEEGGAGDPFGGVGGDPAGNPGENGAGGPFGGMGSNFAGGGPEEGSGIPFGGPGGNFPPGLADGGDTQSEEAFAPQQFPDWMQRPEGFGENTGDGSGGRLSGGPFGNVDGASPQQNWDAAVLLAVSAAVLLAGLAVAFKFKR